MSTDYIKGQFGRPLVNAAVGAVACRAVMGDINLVVGDKRVSALTTGAGLGFASSFVSQFAEQWLVKPTTHAGLGRSMESMVIAVGASAGAFALIPMFLNKNLNGAEAKGFALAGAGTEVVSDYIWRNFVEVM